MRPPLIPLKGENNSRTQPDVEQYHIAVLVLMFNNIHKHNMSILKMKNDISLDLFPSGEG